MTPATLLIGAVEAENVDAFSVLGRVFENPELGHGTRVVVVVIRHFEEHRHLIVPLLHQDDVFRVFRRFDFLLEDVDVFEDGLARVEEGRAGGEVVENVSFVEVFPSSVFLAGFVASLHRIINFESFFDRQRRKFLDVDRAFLGLDASTKHPQTGNL